MFFCPTNLKGTWLTTLLLYDKKFQPEEYYYILIELNFQYIMIKLINMSTIFRQSLSMLGLVVKLSSISFQLRGKSSLSLPNVVK